MNEDCDKDYDNILRYGFHLMEAKLEPEIKEQLASALDWLIRNDIRAEQCRQYE